jgi:hypothetical protein
MEDVLAVYMRPRDPEFHANRLAIDVSGDGTHNDGRAVAEARDEALAKGVTITVSSS